MSSIRKPTEKEQKLIEFLISKSSFSFSPNWKTELFVSSMEDGGMGSLKLFPYGVIDSNSKFGQMVSDFQFNDLDGEVVIASLYLDSNGNLFELDIWKTNFEKLLTLPDTYK